MWRCSKRGTNVGCVVATMFRGVGCIAGGWRRSWLGSGSSAARPPQTPLRYRLGVQWQKRRARRLPTFLAQHGIDEMVVTPVKFYCARTEPLAHQRRDIFSRGYPITMAIKFHPNLPSQHTTTINPQTTGITTLMCIHPGTGRSIF